MMLNLIVVWNYYNLINDNWIWGILFKDLLPVMYVTFNNQKAITVTSYEGNWLVYSLPLLIFDEQNVTENLLCYQKFPLILIEGLALNWSLKYIGISFLE